MTIDFSPPAIQRILRHPLLWLTILWAVFWWPVVSGDSCLYIRDLTFYAAPMKAYMMARFTHGQFPFWTPYLSSGMPFFADPSHQVLYPLNLVFFFAPSVMQGVSWFSIVHLLLGMWGVYALMRVLKASPWVAAWSGALFGICGYTVSITDNVNYVTAVGWVPLALACFIRGLEETATRKMLRYSALASLCVACMVLAGDTFYPLFLGIACVLLFILRLLQGDLFTGTTPRQTLAHIAVMFGLAALLCSAQILPTLELIKYSARQTAMTFDEITVWSFPPMRLIEFIQPFFYGSKYPAPHFIGQFMYRLFREPWADSVYIGLIPVLFSGALATFNRRQSRFWLLVAGVTLFLAMGDFWGQTIYQTALSVIPMLSRQRYMEKFIFWPHLAICVMAGLGAQQLLSNPQSLLSKLTGNSDAKKIGMALGVFLASLLVLVYIPTQLWIIPHQFENSMDWGTHFYERAPHIAHLYEHWVVVMLFVLVVFWQNEKSLRRYLVILMIAALADLGWAHYGHSPLGKTSLLADNSPVVAQQLMDADQKARGIAPHHIRILYDDLIDYTEAPAEPSTLKRIADAYHLPYLTDSYDYYWLYRTLYNQQRLLFNDAIMHGIKYHNGRFAPLQPNEHKLYDNVLAENAPERLAALSAIDYIITPVQPEDLRWDEPGIREAAVNRPFNLRVLAVDNTLPRAYVSPNAIFNSETHDVYKILTPDFKKNGFDNGYRAQVELGTDEPKHYEAPAMLTPLQPDRTQITQDPPEDIRVQVQSPYAQTAWLVVTESWFPGWRATLDDHPAEIILANHRFMSIAIPPGQHTVRLHYTCDRFLPGVILSLLGLLVCAGLMAL